MHIPDSYREFKLVTQDPGLNNIGLSVYELELLDDNKVRIKRIHAETLTTRNVKEITPLDSDLHEEFLQKKDNMTSAVALFVKDEDPCVFVTETAFFDRFHPSSYAVLSMVISEVFDKILKNNPNITLGKLAPKAVKKLFNIAGQKGKDPVKEAVSQIKVIMEKLDVDFWKLDEHSIDAIAIGYAYIIDQLKLKIVED